MAPRLVVLTPARNAAADLPGYFASVERFADAVVALDDGSTDTTGELLESHPLVARQLRNPVRPGYSGWDDAANRNQLLAAAADLEPDWILSLDADERLDASDGAALRRFLRTEADPSRAYLLRVFRMIGDGTRYDQDRLLVGRLFAFQPGQVFPSTRLHLVPIPTSIPQAQWQATTLRIQHLASLTEEDRQARFAKYLEVDPRCEFQDTYDHLRMPPGLTHPWRPRPKRLPVIPKTRPSTPRRVIGRVRRELGDARSLPQRVVRSAGLHRSG